jgi:3-phosphoglycerate kinase
VIGGATKSSQDILDKILLANALLDTASYIILVGEVALAALYALDLDVGKVERTEDNLKQYEKFKGFFLTLFEKAA